MTRPNIHPGLRMAGPILATFLALGAVAVMTGCTSDPNLPAETLSCEQAIQTAQAGATGTAAKAAAAAQAALANAGCITIGTDAVNAVNAKLGATPTATP
jgi:hypothetical protein